MLVCAHWGVCEIESGCEWVGGHPGQGIVQWKAVFDLLREKGYGGYLSFEAPNPTLWARPPAEVTREAAESTRRLLAA